ncbi:hypothetical protein [Micromonospora sagamiensis]|uniref:Lactococcin 972 family bacteriocin n=1 Tax=Micromonospora sagamiensis TaxID=47875 RepID=A0A562WBI4_9ACTN|nr:hypothetical protein [Micromonospora sagamiensis]TWJ27341.1 hypothetical protein JD81_00830 [Micromonospora sagamiensis]BCL13768.1 hypothetical protein GCM10017556_15070 [Micromonospora sagamiensis]
MRMVRKALAATAVAGAFTVSLLAGAAPASAEGTNASGWYTGYGSSSTSSMALYWAENDAKWKADMAGFNSFLDCRVTYSQVTPISQYYYNATVQLYCYNFS